MMVMITTLVSVDDDRGDVVHDDELTPRAVVRFTKSTKGLVDTDIKYRSLQVGRR